MPCWRVLQGSCFSPAVAKLYQQLKSAQKSSSKDIAWLSLLPRPFITPAFW
jgi:hypothetical protein